MKFKDETGNKYNLLTVKEYAGRDKHNGVKWLCECECGSKIIALASNIRRGGTKSCGCMAPNQHGLKHHIHYARAKAMIGRCYDNKRDGYKDYGGRGIKIIGVNGYELNSIDYIPELIELLDCIDGYKKGLTIDRINNDDSYWIGNLKWSTQTQQNYNRRISETNSFGITGLSYRENRPNKPWYTRVGPRDGLVRKSFSTKEEAIQFINATKSSLGIGG